MAEVSYVAIVNLKDVGTYPTFRKAFVPFYHAVAAVVGSETGISNNALENACYIEERDDGEWSDAWSFSAAKRKAFVLGIIDADGELVEEISES